jgi:16S rRNA (guanine(966)-N(2))-methyltransferase RsmD
MRIILGKNKGKHILAPASLPVRPTTDLGKESLFNILNNYFFFDKISVLDLFAGTGNISYEFASRGAISVMAVDNYQGCTDFIRKTAEKLQFDKITVIRGDAFSFVERSRQKFDIIFADPPYDLQGLEIIVAHVFANQLLKPSGWLVLEHPKEYDFSQHPNFYEHRKYGKLNFTFLVHFE